MSRELTATDAVHAVLGGGVLACGGGGWARHGRLMGSMATSLGRPILADVNELPPETWVATVTAIGAPASPHWEIRPVDYIHALEALMEASPVPIGAVMTGQNGYSTTLNGWIQSAALGVAVLDAAGDVRAHPTGKLGSLGLDARQGYTSTQVVSGGNRERHGHFLSINTGRVSTCDDVLRDISVRTGGFIAAARNVVELGWVKDHGALGAISLALDLGHLMEQAASTSRAANAGEAVIDAVTTRLAGRILDRGPLAHEQRTVTRGGWDHGTFRIGDHTVPYLNEYMAADADGQRVATYPDTISILRADTGLPLAVEDAADGGFEVVLLAVDAQDLPLSASAVDDLALAECESIMGIDLRTYTPQRPLPTTT